MNRCPCCGKPTTAKSAPQAVLSAIKVSPYKRAILDTLAHKIGQWVPMQEVIWAVYGDDAGGGPDNPMAQMRVQMFGMKKALRKAGFRIEAMYGGRGNSESFRRLVRAGA